MSQFSTSWTWQKKNGWCPYSCFSRTGLCARVDNLWMPDCHLGDAPFGQRFTYAYHRPLAVLYWIVVAISRYLQNALASCICRGVRHSASNTNGEPTRMQTHFAREVATFRRFEL